MRKATDSLEQQALDLELSIARTQRQPIVAARQRWIDSEGRLFAWSSATSSRATLRIVGSGVYRFGDDSNRVRAFVRPETDSATVERSLREIVMPLALLTRGWQVLHASAVVTPGGVVGLCGRCGAGKSTLARAWIERGAGPWTDDSLAVRTKAGLVEATRWADGRSRGLSTGRAGSRPLVHLVVLEPEDRPEGRPCFERLAPTAALRALLPHALCLDAEEAGVVRRLFRAYADLATTVTIDRLRYRQTPGAAPEIARRLEARIQAGRATRLGAARDR